MDEINIDHKKYNNFGLLNSNAQLQSKCFEKVS
jgi:hypothetical protein